MRLISHVVLALVFVWVGGESQGSGPSAEQLLPVTTKGMIAVPDLRVSHGRWDATQFGRLTANPTLKPFIEDLQRQFREKLNQTGERLSLTWEELSAVHGGEVCVASIEPVGEPDGHALVLIVDTSGHAEPASALAGKIRANLKEREATVSELQQGTVSIEKFELPKKRGASQGRSVAMFQSCDRFVIGDHPETVQGIAERLQRHMEGQPTTGDELGATAPYRAIMARCGMAPAAHAADARWFIEPFGYARLVRAAQAGLRRRGENRIKTLQDQGFDAIQGIGGLIYLSHDQQDIQHRSFVHAPQDEKAIAGERFRGAARMLDFPAGSQLAEPLAWIHQDLSTHATFLWNMQPAFEHLGSLIDSFFKEGFFEDVLESMATDEDGPQLDIRKELVANLGQRVVVLVDHTDPITTDSERVLVGLELQNDACRKQVQGSLDRSLSTDPGARRVDHNGHTIWEFFESEDEELAIEGLESFEGSATASEDEDGDKLWSHAAIVVAHGYLLMGSDIDIVKKVLTPGEGGATAALQGLADYQRLRTELDQLNPQEGCAQIFTRQDESLHPSYELWRQGKMPQAKTILGRLLNRMFPPEEKGVKRKQQIDGSQLPDYSVVAPYLGPSGIAVLPEADGWYVSGVFLPKSPQSLTSKESQRTAESTADRGSVKVKTRR